MLTERLPQFPFTVQKVENHQILFLEKKYKATRSNFEAILRKNKEHRRKMLNQQKVHVYKAVLEEIRDFMKKKMIKSGHSQSNKGGSGRFHNSKSIHKEVSERVNTSIILEGIDTNP